jgi:Putative DNA-binding domain
VSVLADLQRDLQHHVLNGDAAIATAVHGTADVPVATRLGVYSNAYRSRLAEALGDNMSNLCRFLGEDEFSTVANRYIDRYPSQVPSIRWFGHRLAEQLEDSHRDRPWVAELARWEWALAASFDAQDVPAVGIEALAGVAPGEWGELRLEFHPSVQQLELQTNAQALFKALSEDHLAPDPAVLEHPQPWLLWRQDLKTQYRSLEPAETAALGVVRGGGTFGEMCEALCAWHEADEVPLVAAGMLKRWIVEQLIVRLA